MNSFLEQLHDIDGLDFISAWPLATGWWVVAACVLFILLAIGFFAINKLAFKRSWKNDSLQKLFLLENQLSPTTTRETLILLSEYLRRISLQQFSRKECAGLAGTCWLKWLADNDPKGFEWEKKGALLIEVPYSPTIKTLSIEEIQSLIRAVREWVQ
jgi:hypothetical protein